MLETLSPLLNVSEIRKQFALLDPERTDPPMCYLDTGATALKPDRVVERIRRYYERQPVNVHRGAFALSDQTTADFEAAREAIRSFLNAESEEEIVFTGGCTDALNLVAHGLARQIGAGDEIVVTHLEHHANLLPWMRLCEESGARLRIVPIDDHGALDLSAYLALLGAQTRVVAVTHISNVLGTVNPIAEISAAAHAAGALVVVDAAQSAPHARVDVRALGVDFLAFSGHKLYGPTGVGVLYGRREQMEELDPFRVGGAMIQDAYLTGYETAPLPHRLEAGTPPIAQALGLAEAVVFVNETSIEAIEAHEKNLTEYALDQLSRVPRLKVFGPCANRAGILSFAFDDIHSHDLGSFLDQKGIAVRTGQHCAHPLLRRLGVPSIARASLGPYTDRADVDRLLAALHESRRALI
jgi:cysteine desulfurase/selenocysteine lyase